MSYTVKTDTVIKVAFNQMYKVSDFKLQKLRSDEVFHNPLLQLKT